MEYNEFVKNVVKSLVEYASKDDFIALIVNIYLKVTDIDKGLNEAELYNCYYYLKDPKTRIYEIAEDFFMDPKTLYRFRKRIGKIVSVLDSYDYHQLMNFFTVIRASSTNVQLD